VLYIVLLTFIFVVAQLTK